MTEIHIDWPDYSETKRILAGIVQEAGGTFENKTNLFKAYYWAHRYYWEDHDGLLTRKHRLVHMPNGPGIDGHDAILEQLSREGWIEAWVQPWGNDGKQWKFESRRSIELSDDERDSIHRAIARVRGQTAASVSDDSHAESRTWRTTKNGEPLDVYLDAVDDAEFARRDDALTAANAELDEVLRKFRSQ